MRPSKDPLEPLAQLRDARVDEATERLACAARERRDAEGRRVASSERREGHSRRAEAVRDVERESLHRGERTAADLARAGAWETRMSAEARALEEEEGRARAEEQRAKATEAAARGQLVARRAEADAVSEHLARRRVVLDRSREAAEEEASIEAWRPSKP